MMGGQMHIEIVSCRNHLLAGKFCSLVAKL
jgi:hypothetical protein